MWRLMELALIVGYVIHSLRREGEIFHPDLFNATTSHSQQKHPSHCSERRIGQINCKGGVKPMFTC